LLVLERLEPRREKKIDNVFGSGQHDCSDDEQDGSFQRIVLRVPQAPIKTAAAIPGQCSEVRFAIWRLVPSCSRSISNAKGNEFQLKLDAPMVWHGVERANSKSTTRM
jgi:hypothetical protein